MKLKTHLILLLILSLASCEVDNYDEPQLTFSGKIVDSQTNDLIPSGGLNSGTVVRLYEVGSNQPLVLNTLPDGTFTFSKVFAGDYSYTAEGPFELATARDTLDLGITENTDIEIQVIPNGRLNATIQGVDGTSARISVQYEKIATNQDLVELGVVWSEFRNPDVYVFPDGGILAEDADASTPAAGTRNFVIEGLAPNTTYYLRAFSATNNPGNYYNYSTPIELITN